MNQERLLQIIVSPKISEKAARVGDRHRQYVFQVLGDATKPEIKAAVEDLFKVKVENVTTANMPPRLRRFRGQVGVKQGWKKAYVKLETGFDIDYMVGD